MSYRRRIFAFILTLLPLTVAGAPEQSAWVMHFDGIGPIKVGMTLRELNKVLGTSYKRPTEPDEEGCFYVDVHGHRDLEVMVLDGRVARMDVTGLEIRTDTGIRVGDTQALVLKTYGRELRITPNPYDAQESRDLTAHSHDGKLGIRFLAHKGRIEMYYAGTAQAIEFIEGCE